MIPYKGRDVEIEEVVGSEDDICVLAAYWVDTGVALDDTELDDFQQDCSDVIYDYWYQYQVGNAEYSFEGDR